MKKLAILLVSIVLVSFLSAKLMQPTLNKIPIEKNNGSSVQPIVRNFREAPEHEFVTLPTDIFTNYYDYMPGSYNGTPVRIQPDEFGGVYLVFHARETADATRREYYSYINTSGNITTNTVGDLISHEGYASICVDAESEDAHVAWHVNSDGSGDLEVVYDVVPNYPGGWIPPIVVIDDSIPSPNGALDEFIWPYIFIGPSPQPDMRRIYIQANNSYSASDPSENPMIAYADFDQFIGHSTEWEYVTIPIFDSWNQGNPEWVRPFHSFDVSKVDGRIAFFGYNTNDEVYVCYNDNYGEGDWTFVSEAIDIDTWNPQNLDGTYVFVDENGDPQELYWAPIHSGHMTSIFHNGSNNMTMQINMGLQMRPDATGNGFYYPYGIFPYIINYNFISEEFHHIIANPLINENAVNLEYVHSWDEEYTPWDTDNDGIVDEFDEEGNVVAFNGWPIWFWDNDVAFHETLAKVAINDEKGWIVHIWMDGLKNKLYNDNGNLNYEDWAEIAEIYITVSNNNGESWSDPIIMNANDEDVNFVEELDGMKPCYIYPGDKIEDLGNGWGLVHLMFLDDYSFGSHIQGYGGDLGGMMKYATIKIQFDSNYSSEENQILITDFKLQNYPNPFNPSTTISFELTAKDAKNAKIEIFNLKGQKVDQLQIMNYELGNNEVTWNAEDFASGIYFYQLKYGDEIIASKKCLLLK